MNIKSSLKPDNYSFPIKGVIFDLDGVLTDTAEYHYQSWQKLSDEEGIPFNRQANESLRGVSRRDSLLAILQDRQVSEEKIQEMMDRKNKYYLELIEHISPNDLLPGVLNLLSELKEAGIKIAIGSASKNAKPVIQKLGIANYIDTISDGYSVINSKPAPDLFLHAAKQLNLPPENCLVVEDAASGVEAALAAKMGVVGIGDRQRVGSAHLVLENLDGIHW